MNFLDKVNDFFKKQGYVELRDSKQPKNLLWQPDLWFKKGSHLFPILVKSNNSILPAFLSRMSKSASNSIVPVVIFAGRPTDKDEAEIVSLGIGVGYLQRGKIIGLNIKTKPSKEAIKREIKRKLEHIDIFVSSKQTGLDGIELKERSLIRKTINLLRDTNNYPFTGHLIEYDRFKMAKLYPYIDSVMENCEWIIILLEDNHSDTVTYEIKKALKEKDHDNIIILVKETRSCKEKWKKELNMIIKLPEQSIKFLPYSDLSDLEVTLIKAINKRMKEICQKRKIEIFV